MTDWNEDEAALLEQIGRFAQNVLAPRAAELDETATFAVCHLPAMADLGLMGLNLPQDDGGLGLSGPALYRAVELIAGACGSTASLLQAHYLATDSLHLGADAALRARFLPRAAAGSLGAFALTEPQAGSNPADMRTLARRDGAGYRLRGAKCFISNAGAADFMVVYAKTDPQAGARGVSAFVLEPKATEGIGIAPAERTMGLRGGHVFGVTFDDCFVPEENRIGAEGTGFRTAMKVLDNGRIEVAAQATGIAAAALDAAVAYSKERQVGGHPIADFQGLQWMLADSANDLAAARALGLAAAWLRGTGARYSTESAHAKLFASEAAWRIADRALQIHGGYGYCRDFPLERYLRDLRIFRIYEGSSEIQRSIIARGLLA